MKVEPFSVGAVAGRVVSLIHDGEGVRFLYADTEEVSDRFPSADAARLGMIDQFLRSISRIDPPSRHWIA